MLAASSEAQLAALLTAFLRLLATLNDHRRYLGIADREAIRRELSPPRGRARGRGRQPPPAGGAGEAGRHPPASAGAVRPGRGEPGGGEPPAGEHRGSREAHPRAVHLHPRPGGGRRDARRAGRRGERDRAHGAGAGALPRRHRRAGRSRTATGPGCADEPGALLARLAVSLHQRLRAAVDRLGPAGAPPRRAHHRGHGHRRRPGRWSRAGSPSGWTTRPARPASWSATAFWTATPPSASCEAPAAVGLLDRRDAGFRRNRLTRALQPDAPRTLGPLAVYFASEHQPPRLEPLPRGGAPAARCRSAARTAAASGSTWPRRRRTGAHSPGRWTRSPGWTPRRWCQTPGFSGVAGLCDVAGGTGALLEAALRAHPGLEGVLVDAPAVVQLARGRFERSGLLGQGAARARRRLHPRPGGSPGLRAEGRAARLGRRAGPGPAARWCAGRCPRGPGCSWWSCCSRRGRWTPLASLVDLQMLAITDGGRQRSAERADQAAPARPASRRRWCTGRRRRAACWCRRPCRVPGRHGRRADERRSEGAVDHPQPPRDA